MAILEIKTHPDPILRKVATSIENITGNILKLADNMVDTMVAARGAVLRPIRSVNRCDLSLLMLH
jgi:peptide deformylase